MRRRHERGKESDRSALRQHQARLRPVALSRYSMRTYAMRFTVSEQAFTSNMPNHENRWYFRNSKRGGMRRRYEPYWTELCGVTAP